MSHWLTIPSTHCHIPGQAAQWRHDWNDSNGVSDRYGAQRNLRIDEMGCQGEYGFATFLGVDWVAFATNPKELESDVAGFQVRSTDYYCGRLLLHDADRDDQRFVLVRVQNYPTIEVVGWCFGSFGKQGGHDGPFWTVINNHKDRPCYAVDAAWLTPFELGNHVF